MQKSSVDTASHSVEIDRLREHHSHLEKLIRELEAHLWLSPEEQTERSRLKKEKLATKDRLLQLGAYQNPRA